MAPGEFRPKQPTLWRGVAKVDGKAPELRSVGALRQTRSSTAKLWAFWLFGPHRK
jgi:hypothetical protein